MKELFLIRHSSAESQDAEVPLTDAGILDSAVLANRLVGTSIERVVSSPYRRAVQTGTPISTALGVPLVTDARLIEMSLSSGPLVDWKDHLRKSFEQRDYSLPGGETADMAMNRSRAAVDDALQSVATTVAVVTHGRLLTLILKSFGIELGYDGWERLTNPDVFHLATDLNKPVALRHKPWRTAGFTLQ
jgi:2,3-bisphosphoglycerate-dependent phosphoglycerate mutase